MSFLPSPVGTALALAQLLQSSGAQYLPAAKYLPGAVRQNSSNFSGPLTSTPSVNPNRAGASPVPPGGLGGIGGAAGNIAKGITSRLKGMPQQQAPTDPLMDLYNQLLNQLQQPVSQPQAVDKDDLMRQIQNAINPIYDQRVKSAQGQSDRNRGEVKDMYRALSNDYERLAPQQIDQAAAAQKEIEQLYGQLRSNVEGSYSRVSKEQSDLFKQLGIEQALPDVLAEQQAPVQDTLNAASENQAQQEQRYMDIGQMDSTYMRQGSPIATMAGNEISTDMLSQLQDYLGQIEAERSSGIQGAYNDQLGQANSQLAQQQQNSQNEAARRQEMLFSLLQGQMSQKAQPLTADSFMSSLPAPQQQALAGAFTRLQRSPEAVYGKTKDPRNPASPFVETTPQWYMAQADEMLQRGEIDTATHQALLMYLQLQGK
jgi:hypothetical protein